jgi:hypothetical protein
MKYALIALGFFITTAAAHAECYKVISGDRVRTGWGMSEQGYSVECDDGSYQEDRGLTNEQASERLDQRQLEADRDAEFQQRIEEEKAAARAEQEKEAAKALVHPPISY